MGSALHSSLSWGWIYLAVGICSLRRILHQPIVALSTVLRLADVLHLPNANLRWNRAVWMPLHKRWSRSLPQGTRIKMRTWTVKGCDDRYCREAWRSWIWLWNGRKYKRVRCRELHSVPRSDKGLLIRILTKRFTKYYSFFHTALEPLRSVLAGDVHIQEIPQQEVSSDGNDGSFRILARSVHQSLTAIWITDKTNLMRTRILLYLQASTLDITFVFLVQSFTCPLKISIRKYSSLKPDQLINRKSSTQFSGYSNSSHSATWEQLSYWGTSTRFGSSTRQSTTSPTFSGFSHTLLVCFCGNRRKGSWREQRS